MNVRVNCKTSVHLFSKVSKVGRSQKVMTPPHKVLSLLSK